MTPDPPPVHQCACTVCQAGTDPPTVQQHAQINLLLSRLSEPQRRWYAGTLSQAPNGPSDRQLSVITGLDPKTIARGRAELAAGLPTVLPPRQRRPGAGRPRAEKRSGPDERAARGGRAPHGGRPDDGHQVVELPLAGPADRLGHAGPCGQLARDQPAAAGRGLPAAQQLQAVRRPAPPGSRRAVCAHRGRTRPPSGRRSARHQRRYQEAPHALLGQCRRK